MKYDKNGSVQKRASRFTPSKLSRDKDLILHSINSAKKKKSKKKQGVRHYIKWPFRNDIIHSITLANIVSLTPYNTQHCVKQ